MASDKEALLLRLGTNPRLAHQALFEHRHPQATPPFHFEIIDAWHSDRPRIVTEAFRDAAKSTIMEEVFVIRAAFQKFGNGIVIGASYERAVERLQAIKFELETNEMLEHLFGDLRGPTWGESHLVLKNGVSIRAFGSGQSLRGSKHHEKRPDFGLMDDLEDEETVRTPEARRDRLRWLYRTALPAFAKHAQIRLIGNRLDSDAVIVRVAKDSGWYHQRYPIMYQANSGEEHDDLPPGKWVPMWPGKYPLAWIGEKRMEYVRQGLLSDFNCEYLCEAEDPAVKTFRAEDIKTEALVRTWHRVDVAYDPARTVNKKSASTGKVVFSWIGPRLVVWSGEAKLWMPDQLVNDVFATDREFSPTVIGIEETGLNEWIKQPLRAEMTRRRVVLNLEPLPPPRGKLQFIEGLQPFFRAGEVIFVNVSDEAKAQLLGYPTGNIDFPNALAYALRMRPGQAIFPGFAQQFIVEGMRIHDRAPLWLIVNAEPRYTVAALAQLVDGSLHLLADFAREGGPGEALLGIVQAAALEAGRTMRVIAPPRHFQAYDTLGLKAAAARVPIEVRTGAQESLGREEVRALMRRNMNGLPCVLVSSAARLTLQAFAGGYCQDVAKDGTLTPLAKEGPHRTLMEGIESFCALLQVGAVEEVDASRNYAYTDTGRRYLSALATRH
jgi:hypothetical protein